MNHFNLNALTSPITTREGLTHAVLQSIHNQAESTKNDQVRMGVMDRGGCWSQALLDIVGSRDWTIKREKLTPQTLSLAKRFYEESLAWLVRGGHAKSVQVCVWEEKPNQMGRDVVITLSDDSKFKVPL